MTTWAEYSHVTARTFILSTPVLDIDDFAGNHAAYLVGIDDDPGRARDLWRQHRQRHAGTCEGFVSLTSNGQELVPPDLWCDVIGFWHAVVEIVVGFHDSGAGTHELSDQPVTLGLRKAGAIAVFSIAERSYTVDPVAFPESLADEADRFFDWT